MCGEDTERGAMRAVYAESVDLSVVSMWSVVSTQYSLSDVTNDSGALNVDNDIVGDQASHHGLCLSDERRVARNYSLNDVASDSNALNGDNDIIGEKPSHHGPVLSYERGVARKCSMNGVC